ncbi:hypothetical protein GCM10010967_39720 [Dyadobacter beijingensis]|uniref:Uncharacterized protein n=1 Tax=Dyadobacter beijingensis TaxID=365489 RepID=A0ABQ2I7X6_9BACT|nr:hypothetical protein [Dyadobacter beijingensis]GGN01369.1 hypothetical protein GCM10010967_39720 [Dyadobacter beijingensis]
MNSKLIRTIFLALAFGFLALWVLEFRRAGLFESYWLLLLCVICFLLFQFSRLKAASLAKQAAETGAASKKPGKASAVGGQPSAVSGQPSSVSGQPSAASPARSKPGKNPKK